MGGEGMDRRQVIWGIGAGVALAGCSATAAQHAAGGLRIDLLGQALIEHAPTPAEWPGREGVVGLLSDADVVFTNLETVIQGPRAGAPTRDLLTLHASGPEILDALKATGVNLLTTANNHAFDLDSGGILDTLDAITAAGLVATGSGADLARASAPAAVESPNGKVSAIGFATGKVRPGGAAADGRPGVNELRRDATGAPLAEDEARILEAIRQAAASSVAVIACHHNHDWEEDNAQVPGWQQALARRCIDAGATVFLGHGSPVLQAMSAHNGRPQIFGLGNFIFQTEKPAGAYPPAAWEGIVVSLTIASDKTITVGLTPLLLNEIGLGGPDDHATRGFPRLALGGEATDILTRLQTRSEALGGRMRIHNGRAALTLA